MHAKFAVFAVSLSLVPAGAVAAALAGQVTHIRDGDTIEIEGIAIRLQGLHAPQLSEPGGPAAAEAMAEIIAASGGRLSCELTGETSYDRLIAVCFTVAGEDIAALLIATGLARDCPHFSGGRYQVHETSTSRLLPLPGY